jgi:hypothetical protein
MMMFFSWDHTHPHAAFAPFLNHDIERRFSFSSICVFVFVSYPFPSSMLFVVASPFVLDVDLCFSFAIDDGDLDAHHYPHASYPHASYPPASQLFVCVAVAHSPLNWYYRH